MLVADKVDRPKTLVFKVPEELRVGSKEDFAVKIVNALKNLKLVAIQFVPGWFVRVTFEFLEDREDIFRDGLVIDGVDIRLIEAEPSTQLVYVHHCPVEVPNSVLENVLSAYGDVISIAPCYYNTASILTGFRVVKMSLRRDVHPRIYVLRYPCRVWYRDQPLTCLICSLRHRVSDCPLRGRCRRCRQPGHIARDCTASAPSSAPVSSDVPVSSSAVSTPVPPDDASDSGSSDELASGDEEVLATTVSLSPRRTRSASKRPAEPPVPPDDHPPTVHCKKPAVSSDASGRPPSISSSVPAVASPHAVVFCEDGVSCSIDLHRLTRRCVLEDTATPEMYRECFYADPKTSVYVPVMSVFPSGRAPLPDDLLLSSDVLPAKFPRPG